MHKREELANPDSCLNKASDEEPLFVLRANDECAPEVVKQWAAMYYLAKGGATDMTSAQMEKYKHAHDLASEMERWKFNQRLKESSHAG